MAWIKVTGFAVGNKFCINTDKLMAFGQPPGEAYTALWEPGDVEKGEDLRRVKETPDELLALIREAEAPIYVLPGRPDGELLNYAFPPEELK